MAEYKVYVEGEIDMANAPRLRDDIIEAIQRRGSDVDIDFVDATFMDCAGINVLIELRNLLDANGHQLRLLHLGSGARRPIDVLGLAGFLNVDEPNHRKVI